MKQRLLKYWNRIRPMLFSELLVCTCLAVLVSAFTLNLKLYRVEAFFYDLRMRIKGTETVNPNISLLVVGESEDNDENGFMKYNTLENQIKVLQRLVKEKPAAIAYLNKFDPGDVEAHPDLAAKFVDIANQAQNDGTRIFFGTDVDLGGEVLPPYPLSLLPHSPAVIHKDGTIFAQDKVVRRSLLTVYDEPSLHLRLAYPDLDRDELLKKAETVRGAYFFKPAGVWHMFIHYPGSTEQQKSVFPKLYFADILAYEHKPLGIGGKIVLIDTIRKDNINDFAATPYSQVTYTNSRLDIHAAILNTLLEDNGYKMISSRSDMVLTILLSIILSYITILYSPLRGVVSLIAMTTLLSVTAMLLFRFGDMWLRILHPLCVMFFANYLILPYRAIIEYKKRWEVQQKHDLLVQVEEMKGNFLSLMSHDLKTPVARIQGLAELVLKQGQLQEAQTNNVQQILDSTENLDKFISKILNLTKVESNEIKLNRRSKDINKIIEQCVKKLEFQARNKQIHVDMQLEPLFPIHVDSALLIQVFTNIIDNAIKYSPEGSHVEIRSKEVGNHVEVVVRDAGGGMDEDELRQLFTKFFRGKSHPGDQTKGSGLGLYLSRYFIELHNGAVFADSEKGKGSSFTIQLPINSIS